MRAWYAAVEVSLLSTDELLSVLAMEKLQVTCEILLLPLFIDININRRWHLYLFILALHK